MTPEFRFVMSALPIDMVTRFSRQFGSLNEAQVFTPYDWDGSAFELRVGRLLGETGAPLVLLAADSGAIVPQPDGWLEFAIDPAPFLSAGIRLGVNYPSRIVRLLGGEPTPFADGPINFSGRPVS
jgi:hypothetical protein